MTISAETARRSDAVFKRLSDERDAPERFNPFDPDQVRIAALIGLDLALVAEESEDDDTAIGAVLNRTERHASDLPPGLVQHGLAIFATHMPKGKLMGKPRMMSARPRGVLPGRTRGGLEAAFGPEAALDYWRENALANEHHAHWHEVYPAIGVLRPIADIPPEIITKIQTQGWGAITLSELAQVFQEQDRHGELFVYMHQQMLARYDAERLSIGLDPVTPFAGTNLAAPMPEAFDPGPSLSGEFVGRPANAQIDSAAADRLQMAIAEIRAAIAAGAFQNVTGGETPITPTVLGNQIEAAHSLHRGDVDQDLYGNLHNAGHGAIAQAAAGGIGVMASTATAIRDPIFFRWHKLIDDLAFEWQETRPPLDLSDAPGVSFAGADAAWDSHGLLMIDSNSLPSDPADADALVAEAFGGPNWDTRFSAGPVAGDGNTPVMVLDTITTHQRFADFPDPEQPGSTIPVAYLAHDPVTFAVRLSNPATDPADVTIRLFLCPADQSDDRRAWIELDKWSATIPGGGQTVSVRHDRDSAVVKKPAEPVMSPDLLADPDGDPRCDCGWPYTLFYPRGTEAGMAFHLMAILTDAALDNIAAPGACGSLSFCGARDALYPDRRDMGYPFHVPWATPIGDTIAQAPSMAGRSLTIRHVPFGSS